MTQEDTLLWDCFHDGDLIDVKRLCGSQIEFVVDIPYLSFHMFGKVIPFRVLVESCGVFQIDVVKDGVEKSFLIQKKSKN